MAQSNIMRFVDNFLYYSEKIFSLYPHLVTSKEKKIGKKYKNLIETLNGQTIEELNKEKA